MERFEHIRIPAWNRGISIANGIKQVRDNSCFNTRHITGRYKDKVALRCKNAGMQTPDRADSLTDIGNAPDPLQSIEAPALFRIFGNNDDLIGYMPERIREPFDKGLSLVPEKKFFLPFCPAGFPADKDNRRSQFFSLPEKTGLKDWIMTEMKVLHHTGLVSTRDL